MTREDKQRREDPSSSSNSDRRNKSAARTTAGHANRNSVRSLHSMNDAFGSLLQTTPYKRISIQEVMRQANLGYSTFYRHYPSEDSLLEDFLHELVAHVQASMGELSPLMDPWNPQPFLILLLARADGDEDMLRARIFVANRGNRRMLAEKLLDEVAPAICCGVGRWTLCGTRGALRQQREEQTLRYVLYAGTVTLETLFCYLQSTAYTRGGRLDADSNVNHLTAMYGEICTEVLGEHEEFRAENRGMKHRTGE